MGTTGWSQDGEDILFALNPAFSASIAADGLPLFVVPAAGGEAQKLDGTFLVRDELFSEFSPSRILALTEGGGRETWTHKRVATADPAGGSLTYLTDPEVAALSPAWSPDGRLIAYVAGPDIGRVGGGQPAREGMAKRRIWIMSANGSDKRQLTDDGYRDERPLWSADGSHILFARIDIWGAGSLWLGPAGGGEPTQLADLTWLSGLLPPSEAWFGFYGYIAWDRLFDWWQPPTFKAP